jgi:hypothetical protein
LDFGVRSGRAVRRRLTASSAYCAPPWILHSSQLCVGRSVPPGIARRVPGGIERRAPVDRPVPVVRSGQGPALSVVGGQRLITATLGCRAYDAAAGTWLRDRTGYRWSGAEMRSAARRRSTTDAGTTTASLSTSTILEELRHRPPREVLRHHRHVAHRRPRPTTRLQEQ